VLTPQVSTEALAAGNGIIVDMSQSSRLVAAVVRRAAGASDWPAAGASHVDAGSGAPSTSPATRHETASDNRRFAAGRNDRYAADTGSCRPPRGAWIAVTDAVFGADRTSRLHGVRRIAVSTCSTSFGKSRSTDTCAPHFGGASVACCKILNRQVSNRVRSAFVIGAPL
jgi:hypothetical protein